MIQRIDAKLERAGYPGGLRGADWVGVKLMSLIAFAVVFFLLGTFVLGSPVARPADRRRRWRGRVPRTRVLAREAASVRGRWRWCSSSRTRSTC